MNRHFEDTRYYLERAVETASKGVRAELEPVETRVRDLIGVEREAEPDRVERVKRDLTDLQTKAGERGERVIADAREKVGVHRQKDRTEA
ncbi:hypothetical protein KTS45_10605 [Halomicroarcula limicola]|uniref:Uncharacterized protein n=1 Tax=Haloarcula limicola TaxID=1429915 RepID=A0A8J7YA44_9EURY|nr:hypothetical protein [Halomicroarcula limicola]MBV0924648.1 hypothetical protein [Halomicroarcula limicola]